MARENEIGEWSELETICSEQSAEKEEKKEADKTSHYCSSSSYSPLSSHWLWKEGGMISEGGMK